MKFAHIPRRLEPLILALVFCLAAPATARAFDPETLRLASEAEVQGDYAAAVRLYRDLAAEGCAPAMYSLGVFYRNGSGVVKNDVRAFEWFLRAARRGHTFAEYEVGMAYLRAAGVARDEKAARLWLGSAAQRYGEAAYQLYEVSRNDQERRRWLEQSVRLSSGKGMKRLSEAYARGELGLKADPAMSRKWAVAAGKAEGEEGGR